MRRIEYIDALKGLAMFTVVYSHLLLFCLPPYPSSFIIDLLRLFYLNGFFFISGYLFYKPASRFNNSFFCEFAWKKTYQILIPTLVVGAVFMISRGMELIPVIYDDAKMGYWFTFTLYLMMLLTAGGLWLIQRINALRAETLFLIGIAAFAFWGFRFFDLSSAAARLLSLGSLLNYLPMFVLGALCRKFSGFFENRLLDSKWFLPVCALLVGGSFCFQVPLSVTGVSIVALFFGVARNMFSPGYIIPHNYMRAIWNTGVLFGKNSLEIYLVHYFLLFPLPAFCGNYLTMLSASHKSLSFPEFLIVGSVAVLICAASVLIAVLVKHIPVMGKLAFGR